MKVDIFALKIKIMQCTVHFFLLNDDYSVEHADANGVEESAINRKYEWRDELKITTDVTNVVENSEVEYPLVGSFEDGEEFSFAIPGMRLFTLSGEENVIIGCSEALFDSVKIESTEEITVNIYLKDYEPLTNPIPGIYICTGDFPKELVS
ncbi:MAG: hypothetical protein ACI865_001466 [Flavobacteriaceae bacterium]